MHNLLSMLCTTLSQSKHILFNPTLFVEYVPLDGLLADGPN